MALINGIFVVDFDEFSRFVVYFLIKSHCYLIDVNLFHIAGFPALATPDIKPIFSSTSFENFPVREFSLILFTVTHLVLTDDGAYPLFVKSL